jgi:putative ABC transport system substrate-binding protein
MTMQEDPIGAGLIQSLAHPGGNVTGLSVFGRQLSEKRLELLRETVPTATRVGVFWDPRDPSSLAVWDGTVVAAGTVGVELQSIEVRSVEEFEQVAEAAARDRLDAVILSGGSLVNGMLPARIADFTRRHRLPSISGANGSVRAGGLMSYGPSTGASHRRAAYYVDRILKGTQPADLPVEQPMTFEFVVNMKTARELGITFPHEIQLQITEVIE